MHEETFNSYTDGLHKTNWNYEAAASLAVADALNRVLDRLFKIEDSLNCCITVMEDNNTILMRSR